jgi:hypothetical protein
MVAREGRGNPGGFGEVKLNIFSQLKYYLQIGLLLCQALSL